MMSGLLKLDVFLEVKVLPRSLAVQWLVLWTAKFYKKEPLLASDEFEANQRQARQAKGFTK
jgi:hypothetical protein